MMHTEYSVFHVVGRDPPSSRLSALRALCETAEFEHARVVHVGQSPPPDLSRRRVEHMPPPMGLGWLSNRSPSGFPRDPATALLHVWSPDALGWCTALVQRITHRRPPNGGPRILLDFDFPFDPRRYVDSLRLLIANCPTRFVCPSEAFCRRLLNFDVDADQCVLIRDAVEPAEFAGANRADLRERLGLAPTDTAILILPPLTRQSGAFIATWGAILLAHARTGIHILTPDEGPEAARTARLARSCRFDAFHRVSLNDFSLAQLLTAADLATYAPLGDAPLWGLAWAAASGRPLVISDVRVTRELIESDASAWTCRPNDPRDVARKMLNALEDVERSRRQAETACKKTCVAFDQRRMLDKYRLAYRELFGERTLGRGLEIPLVD